MASSHVHVVCWENCACFAFSQSDKEKAVYDKCFRSPSISVCDIINRDGWVQKVMMMWAEDKDDQE